MTNGPAWVLDDRGDFAGPVNAESVDVVESVTADDAEVKTLIERHLQMTGRRRLHHLLADRPTTRGQLRKVVLTAVIELAKLRTEQEAEASAVPADQSPDERRNTQVRHLPTCLRPVAGHCLGDTRCHSAARRSRCREQANAERTVC